MKKLLIAILLLNAALVANAAERNPAQVRAFRKVNPCPLTQETIGPCKGFVVDHIVPLCFGGADNLDNMQWQEVRASYKKDVFERQACALKKKMAELK